MRQLLPLLALVFLLFSCKKEDEQPPQPPSHPDKIVLQDPSVQGDSLVLTWSRLENPGLVEYRLVRREDPAEQGQLISPMYTSTGKFTATTWKDRAVPYAPYVDYQVIGMLSTGQTISSNVVTHNRPSIKPINISAFDVQFDQQRRTLFLFEKTGRIAQYNVDTEQLTQNVNTGATIGYCDFATYNGIRELYVPRNDGWVFVYDAATLTKIDQLNVGTAASCVVAHNNLLFVSTNAWTNRPLKVYNRATKTLVTETGDWNATRFKRIPNSTTELLEITLNVGPTDQHYYNFTAAGALTNHFADRYHGDYPLDATIFELFPNGTKFITSSAGAIYSKNLVYEGLLPRGTLEFTSFCFDATGQSIYGGTNKKTVEVYNTSGYTNTRSIKTKAHPYRLFADGSGLLCVSSTRTNSGGYNVPTKLVVEKLP